MHANERMSLLCLSTEYRCIGVAACAQHAVGIVSFCGRWFIAGDTAPVFLPFLRVPVARLAICSRELYTVSQEKTRQ